jgi:hypothetical protein
VNDCVTAATTGDTITVPSGTATWTSAIALPSTTDLTLSGATVVACSGAEGTAAYACTASGTPTDITCNAGCVQIDLAASHTITGFTFRNNGSGHTISSTGTQGAAKHFRIHHNHLISTSGWNPVRLGAETADSSSLHPQGIWDHNLLQDGISIHTNGTLCALNDSCGALQHGIWARTPVLGDSEEVVYVEGNYYVIGAGIDTTNFTDGNYGARAVIRFNATSGSATAGFEFHSVQGKNRGFQRWEAYHNHLVDQDIRDYCYHGQAFIRGGTGVYFENHQTGDFDGCNHPFLLDNVRSNDAYGGDDGIAACAGASAWDENTGGEQGWHCRDQVGVTADNSLWSHLTTPAWNQALRPAYLWGNTRGGAAIVANVSDEAGRSALHIVANRDYYDHSTATGAPQTAGVRVGTLANRPATCTTGVAYWVTDRGKWRKDTAANAADGVLHRCVSTNTWAADYIPYPYPHPWIDGNTSFTSDMTFNPEAGAATSTTLGAGITLGGGVTIR